jgi:Cu-processing system permease protein
MRIQPFIVATWRAGIRSRSIQGIFLAGLLLIGIAYLSASFSPRQPQTVAMDVGFSGIRLSLVLFSMFWVLELLSLEVKRNTVLFSLSYPVGRGPYLIGRYVGIVSLLLLATGILGACLFAVVASSSGGYEQGFSVAGVMEYTLTLFGLWLDVAVVTAFALWIASISTVSVLPVILGLAFAIGGKALGAVAEYLAKGADGDPAIQKLGPVIDAIHWVLPDLSRLDFRAWPMYGLAPEPQAVALSVVMALAYIAVILLVAIKMFARREFA